MYLDTVHRVQKPKMGSWPEGVKHQTVISRFGCQPSVSDQSRMLGWSLFVRWSPSSSHLNLNDVLSALPPLTITFPHPPSSVYWLLYNLILLCSLRCRNPCQLKQQACSLIHGWFNMQTSVPNMFSLEQDWSHTWFIHQTSGHLNVWHFVCLFNPYKPAAT